MRNLFVSIRNCSYQRILYVLIVLLIVLANGKHIVAQTKSCSYLVWADDFNQNGAPESGKWGYDTGAGGWGNNELQTYTSDRANSWVENGKLFIKAIKTNGNWTSARMVTRTKGDWLYGRIEIKAKLPSGKGTWPAIWMLPTDWAYGNWPKSGEIDIMEHVGYDPGKIHGTAHTEAYNHSIGTQKGAGITIADALTVFHVYAIEWDKDQIKWYVDDQLYFTFSNENKTSKEWPFDKRFHLFLNIAIGGNWGGAQGIDPNLTEATMEVDYVRVYQNQLPKPVIEGKKTLKAGESVTFTTQNHDQVTYEWSFPQDVQIVSGQNKATINVVWGNSSGNVNVKLTSPCESVQSDQYAVSLINTPTGNKYVVPFFSSVGAILWTSAPGNSNQLTLSGTQNLKVVYSISEPNNNPHIVYEFADKIDFSEYRELTVSLKSDPANLPSVIRIDLEDTNGNVNTNDLFKITSFYSDTEFHSFSYQFGKNPNQIWLLNEIKRIKIYINYGIYRKTGSSSVELKELYLSKPVANAVTVLQREQQALYPNPFTNRIYFRGTDIPETIQVFNMAGQLVDRCRLDGSGMIQIKNDLHCGSYIFRWDSQNGGSKQAILIRQ